MEEVFPLRVFVCDGCWLVQTEDFVAPGRLFAPDYAYLSGASSTWRGHVAGFVARATEEFNLGPHSLVVELASNDGVLLENFLNRGVPTLGIEPTASTAHLSRLKGIETIQEFFGMRLATALRTRGNIADLIVGNNVLAHVPDILDFLGGVQMLLDEEGIVSFEFPHLLNMLRLNQFDTIYHEHFSYLSLTAVARAFAEVGLRVWRIEQIDTHGGSLRVLGCHVGSAREEEDSVARGILEEESFGITRIETYQSFQSSTAVIAEELKSFLLEESARGRRVAGLGAAAKGNTLINYAGITTKEIPIIFDSAPSKQGLYTPGARIPIRPLEEIVAYQPDTVVILPWNIKVELEGVLKEFGLGGVKRCTAIPGLLVEGGVSK